MDDLLMTQPLDRQSFPTAAYSYSAWQPRFDKNAVMQYYSMLKNNPRAFDEDQLSILKRHIEHYKIPHEKKDFDNSFNIIRAVRRAAGSYVQGFTTLPVLKEGPKNTAEAIIERAASFAGYVGLGLPVPSLPLAAAGKVTRVAKGAVGKVLSKGIMNSTKAAKVATGFLTKGVPKSIIESSFRLGAAGSISSWTGGVDQMMQGFIGGAKTGAVFGAVGNLIHGEPGGLFGMGKKIAPHQLGRKGIPIWNELEAGQQADLIIRGLSTSLFSGLPATMAGHTTPEQVYEYLLGGYFGITSVPYTTKESQIFIRKMRNYKEQTGTYFPVGAYPEYKNLTPRAKQMIQDWSKSTQAPYGGKSISKSLMKLVKNADKYALEDMLEARFNDAGEQLVYTKIKDIKDTGVSLIRPEDRVNDKTLAKVTGNKVYNVVYYTSKAELTADNVFTEKKPENFIVYQKKNKIFINNKASSKVFKSLKKDPSYFDTIPKQLAKKIETPRQLEEFLLYKQRYKLGLQKPNAKGVNEKANVYADQMLTQFLQTPGRNVPIKLEQYIDTTGKHLWENTKNPKQTRAQILTAIADRWSMEQPENLDNPNQPVNGDNMINWLKNTYDFKNKNVDENFWRGWAIQRAQNVKRPSIMMNIEYDNKYNIIPGSYRATQVMDRMNREIPQAEPLSHAEKVITNKVLGSTKASNKRQVFFFKDVMVTDYYGRKQRMDLKDLHYKNKKHYFSVVRKMDEIMQRRGMYSIGGRGDKADRVYVKYHPGEAAVNVGDFNSQLTAKTQDLKLKGGFEDKGKGTSAGDGKDKAMRGVADNFIGEIYYRGEGNPFVNTGSTQTSYTRIYHKDENRGQKDYLKRNRRAGRDGWKEETWNDPSTFGTIGAKFLTNDSAGRKEIAIMGTNNANKIIMLARNGKFKNKPLSNKTKRNIKSAYNNKYKFVVGDMPGVDSQFIDYLNEIGASYTIYHTGNKSRIPISSAKPQAEPVMIPNKTNKIYHGTLNQNIEIDKKGNLILRGENFDTEYGLGYGTSFAEKPTGDETGTAEYWLKTYVSPDIPLNKKSIIEVDKNSIQNLKDIGQGEYRSKGKKQIIPKGKYKIHKMHTTPQPNSILKAISKTKNAPSLIELQNIFTKDAIAAQQTYGTSYQNFLRAFKSNILWDLEMNGLDPTLNNISKLFKSNMIKSPIEWNKRALIWFNHGYTLTPEMLRKLDPKTANELMDSDGNTKTLLIEDIQKPGGEQNTDGSSASTVRFLKLFNKAVGLPEDHMGMKDVVVSKGASGAMLFKHYVSEADPLLAKFLEQNGIARVERVSSAKQYGDRKVYRMKTDGQKIWFTRKGKHVEKPETYNSHISDFKINTGGYMNKQKAFGPHFFYNQLYTIFSTVNTDTNRQEIQNFFDGTIGRSFEGEAKVNKAYQNMLAAGPAVDKQGNHTPAYETVKNNWRDLGIRQFFNIVQSKKYPNLAKHILKSALGTHKKAELHQSSDVHKDGSDTTMISVNDMINSNLEFRSTLERIFRLDPGGNSIFHLFNKPHQKRINGALKSYIRDKLTKPTIQNSIEAILFPYTEEMQVKDGGYLDKDKSSDKFYLTKAYKQKKIKSPYIKGTQTLGQIWKAYNSKNINPQQKARLGEIFRAAVPRVPITDPAGVPILKFGGFIDKGGYGLVMNNVMMERISGADLDIDKVRVYFGDGSTAKDTEPNAGKYGLKAEWKDMFHRNAKMYLDKDGNPIPPKKNKMSPNGAIEVDNVQNIFAGTTDKDVLAQRRAEGKYGLLRWSPRIRSDVALSVGDARNMLGIFAGGKKSFLPTLEYWKNRKHKYEIMPEYNKTGAKTGRYYVVSADLSPHRVQDFKRIIQGGISYGQDPFDVASITTPKNAKSHLIRSVFDIHKPISISKEQFKKINKSKNPDAIISKLAKTPIANTDYINKKFNRGIQRGIFGRFSNINKAVGGKDVQVREELSHSETVDMINKAFGNLRDSRVPLDTQGSYSTYVASVLRNIDWEIHPYTMIDVKKFGKTLDKYNDGAKKYNWLKDATGRKTMRLGASRKSKPIFVLERAGLINNSATNLDRQMQFENENFVREIDRLANTHIKNYKDTKTRYFEAKQKSPSRRKREIRKLREERASNIRKVQKMADRTIYEDVNAIILPELLTRMRDTISKSEQPKFDKFVGEVMRWKENMIKRSFYRQEGTEALNLDQTTINHRIKEYKKTLSPFQRKIFDYISFGSQIPDTDADTALNSFGYASNAINDMHIRDWNIEMNRVMKNFTSGVSDAELKKQLNQYNDYITHKQSENLNGEVIGTAYMQDGKKELLDIQDVVRNTSEKKLSKKQKLKAQEIYNRIDEIITNKFGKRFDFIKDLNSMVRWKFNKNMNGMTLQNWESFAKFFEDINNPNIMERFLRKGMEAGKDYPSVRGWFYALFPEQMDKYMMAKGGIELQTVKGAWKSIASAPGKKAQLVLGDVKKPTSIVGKLQEVGTMFHEQSNQFYETHKNELQSRWMKTKNIAKDDWDKFFKYMWITQELKDPMVKQSKNSQFIMKTLKKRKQDIEHEIDWNTLKDKTYKYKGKEYKGHEMPGKIHKQYVEFIKKMGTYMSGDKEFLKSLDIYDIRGNLNAEKFEKYILEKYRQDGTVPPEIGLETLNVFAKRLYQKQIDKLAHRKVKLLREKRKKSANKKKINIEINEVQKQHNELINAIRRIKPYHVSFSSITPESYFPHYFDKKVLVNHMKDKLNHLYEDSSLSNEDKVRATKKILAGFDRGAKEVLDGVGQALDETLRNQVWETLQSNKLSVKDQTRMIKSLHTPSGTQNMMRRSNLPNYRIEEQSIYNYIEKIGKSYHRGVAQLLANNMLDKFQSSGLDAGWPKSNVKGLASIFRDYASQAIGNPAILTEGSFDAPEGAPGKFYRKHLVDNMVVKKLNRISEKMGVKSDDSSRKFTEEDLMRFAHLEGTWEMTTLLAHPKFSVANVFTGTANTMINAGVKNFFKARSMKYLKKLNPEWRDRNDVRQDVAKKGIVEEFFLEQMGNKRIYKTKKFKSFMRDVNKMARKDPGFEDVTLKKIAKKHHIGQAFIDTAGKFLSKPERMLRVDAYMAHLINAYENFNGLLKYNDPRLVEIAKRGVKATQFLYTSPHKPMWTNTSIGKMLSRFKLYSWNSVRFRNNIRKEAKLYGFTEGTESYKRFQRLVTGDMMMLGLANIFMYTLFDYVLPQPYDWAQNTANMFFGDDDERDKAFFGTYPQGLQWLQAFTPPMARSVGPMLSGMIDGNFVRKASNQMWTMFPFGRLAKDFAQKPFGILYNPKGAVTKLTGLPTYLPGNIIDNEREYIY